MIGEDKIINLHHSSSELIRALVETNNQKVRIMIDGVEQVWPNRHINKLLQHQHRQLPQVVFQAEIEGQRRAVSIKLPEKVPEALDIGRLNIRSRLYMETLREDYFDRERELIKIMITKVNADKNNEEFHIRLADNMNYFVHHDG